MAFENRFENQNLPGTSEFKMIKYGQIGRPMLSEINFTTWKRVGASIYIKHTEHTAYPSP